MADRPRVVLIGDSIRLGYQPLVAERLDGVEIVGPAENCGDSGNMLARLAEWLDPEVALYLFNAGLHDLRRSHTGGRCQVEVAEYERNLSEIVTRLRAAGAAVAFAAITPVDDERHAASGKPTRLDADVRRYNEAARRTMAALEVPVVDLYAIVATDPALLAADGVHLTDAGSALAAAAVAAAVLDLL